MFRSRAKPCLPLFAAVSWVCRAGLGAGGLFLQPRRDTMNPNDKGCRSYFCTVAAGFCAAFTTETRPGYAGRGDWRDGIRLPSLFAASPRRSAQPAALPAYRESPPPARSCLLRCRRPPARSARGPRLRSELETSRFLFYPAPVTFYLHRQRMLGDKRVFFFFFTSKMFYIFGRVVFPFREVTYILTAVGGLF